MTLTVVEPARQGPLLKNRLVEDATIYREVLDNERFIDLTRTTAWSIFQLPSRIFPERNIECLPTQIHPSRLNQGFQYVSVFAVSDLFPLKASRHCITLQATTADR